MNKHKARTPMQNIERKEKKKLIIKTVIISSILSIIVFCFLSYNIYQRIRYNECLNNNMVLYDYCNGKIDLKSNKEIIDNGLPYYYVLKEGNTITIGDGQAGYIKIYKNNILVSMMVDNYLADFISYFNIKVWFGGTRSITPNREYQIRCDKEYKRTLNGDSYPLFQKKDEVIKINGKTFIN